MRGFTPSSLCLATLLVTVSPVRADYFSFDLAGTRKVQFPSWIPRRPVASAKRHAELAFPIVPGRDNNDLALTVLFREEIGQYLSVYWEDRDGKRQLVCPNLSEDINLSNQRTLLISRAVMGGPGKVVLQSSQNVLNVLRVRVDWARPGVVRLVDGIPNGALITTGGHFYAPEEVDGTALTPVADSWQGPILLTSVTERAERVENGVVFPVAIQAKVVRARVEVLVNGLSLDGSVRLWINGKLGGTLAVEVPDLTDPGYTADGSYVGKAGLLIPPETVKYRRRHLPV